MPVLRNGFKSSPNEYAVEMNRPLYGSHDAPLRWHLTIAKALVRYKFLPFHVDKCLFAFHIPAQDRAQPLSSRDVIIAALVLVHVGDIIFIGGNIRKDVFRKRIEELEHVEYEELAVGTSLKFCGITIDISHDRRLILSQEEFYLEILSLQIKDFCVEQCIIVDEENCDS